MRFGTIYKLREKIRSYYKNMNSVIFISMVLLMAVGLVSIYSATSGAGTSFFMKQALWYAIGFAVMMVFANINYNILINMGNWLYGILLVFLVAVLIFGTSKLGATRWLNIGGFAFQPGEFMKIVMALTLIRYILVKNREAYTVKNIFVMFIILAVPMVLILKQPDLGTTLLLIPVALVIFFIGNMPGVKFAAIVGSGLAALPVIFLFLKGYQKQRILTFLNPELDPLGSGYNVIQSQIAVGAGEWLGRGWMQGTQSQLHFIPIRYTDFIFAVIAEEFGFWGSLAVVAIYFVLIMEALKIVKLCRNVGGKMLAAALTMIFFSQFFINIGMNIGIMPVTG
ncbi:MAG TPA: rod shape-determining protein RodA, partial [Firmicutes bacterium]|nr:rod shape-determining protein RodA [Bacillota bacterium]